MKTRIILLLSIVMLAAACKNNKNVQKTDDTYRVIVSFISKGEGPDSKTLATFESYLITYGKKIGETIIYDKYPWGKEGESDYCFYCKEMKNGEQKDFVTGLTNLTKEAPMVLVKENAVCMHKK
jgi:hypothetical protein